MLPVVKLQPHGQQNHVYDAEMHVSGKPDKSMEILKVCSY